MKTRRRLPTVVALLLFFAAFSPITTVALAQGLQADFDWSMPPRYGVDERTMGTGDPRPDGIVDSAVTFPQTWDLDRGSPAGSPVINPSSWQVDLDASASAGDIVGYAWSFDGEDLGESSSPSISHHVGAEGTYAVTLTVTDSGGRAATITRDVIVQDWLIVAIGDSYASGEGNPENGDQDRFEELVAAYRDLQSVQDELARALETLQAAEIELDLTAAELAPVLTALDRFKSECPSFSVGCLNATRDLISALGQLGFSDVRRLVERGYESILEELDTLRDASRTAVDAARSAVENAGGSANAIQERIDQLFSQGAVWQTIPEAGASNDRACHRSSLSGQSLAAMAIERADPRTSVTFVHVSCSGAKIVADGSSGLIEDQLPQVRALVGDREIDAVVTSIGGNDAGFVKVLTSLVVGDGLCARARDLAEKSCQLICEKQGTPEFVCRLACSKIADQVEAECARRVGEIGPLPTASAETLLAEGLERLRSEAAGYPRLQQALEEQLPALRPGRVFITEYPNLVENDAGEVCTDYLTISEEEWRWARDEMTVSLNGAMAEAAEDHGWNQVRGIFDGSSGHGYCADDHWVVRAEETFFIQGDVKGAAHPNVSGHVLYGEEITAALMSGFYPAGPEGLPRTPGSGGSEPSGASFRRGDANTDGSIDISDGVSVLTFLFLGSDTLRCEDAADVDDSGGVNIADATGLFGFLFTNGQAPAAPGADRCGIDPTGDALGCAAYDSCD